MKPLTNWNVFCSTRDADADQNTVVKSNYMQHYQWMTRVKRLNLHGEMRVFAASDGSGVTKDWLYCHKQTEDDETTQN